MKLAHAFGRDPENPLPEPLLEAKFADCAARALSPDSIPTLVEVLRRIDEVKSLREITETMIPAKQGQPIRQLA